MEILHQWIPEEMLELIGSQLDVRAYATLSASCKTLRKILYDFSLPQVAEITMHQTAQTILREEGHFFLTGAAGTGKTRTLKMLWNLCKKRKVVVGMTATTGIAATNLPQGLTLHSFAGIGKRSKPSEIRKRGALGNPVLAYVDLIVIDEVSMLSPDTLEVLNMYLRSFNNPKKLMGGVKIVFAGDFFQLGPVNAPFVFTSALWKKLDVKVIELTLAQRQQQDQLWYHDLNCVRVGAVSNEVFERLCALYVDAEFADLEDGKYGTVIFPKNDRCAEFNKKAFKRNPNPIQDVHNAYDELYVKTLARATFQADWDVLTNAQKKMIRDYRVPGKLKLKDGALYVLLKNIDVPKGLVNGLVCKYNGANDLMESLPPNYLSDEESKTWKPLKIEVGPVEFKLSLGNGYHLFRYQAPFRLAHALTIHSSQGMTLQKAALDAGTSIFAHGQLYTGLSRTQARKSLALTNLNPRAVRVDRRVIEFYEAARASKRYIRK